MGLYDARCMVTGVSLKGSQAALVLLQQKEELYQPIALAITGQYNRAGSIDMIDEDENTALVLRYFLDQLARGAFAIHQGYQHLDDIFPIETVEHLLNGCERNIHDYPQVAILNGEPVVFALIASSVWYALVRDGYASKGGERAIFEKLFGDVPVSREIDEAQLNELHFPRTCRQ